MPKKEKIAGKPPLVQDVPVAESILEENAPTKPLLEQEVPVAESILDEDAPTKPPMYPSAEPEPGPEPE